MTDLIDRQALLECITKTICNYCDDSKCGECALDNGIFIINTQGNVAPKKGEWIETPYRRGDAYRAGSPSARFHCSNCKHRTGYVNAMKWQYCPNCGADMRGN